MESLSTTNIWLAVLAIVSVLEFLMICAAGIFGYKAYRHVMGVVENVERTHIAPVRSRVDAMLDEVQLMIDRVKHAQASVSDAVRHVTGAGSAIAGTVKSKSWPIAGIINGIRSAAASLKNGKSNERPVRHYGT
jgi:hypothetical protein